MNEIITFENIKKLSKSKNIVFTNDRIEFLVTGGYFSKVILQNKLCCHCNGHA